MSWEFLLWAKQIVVWLKAHSPELGMIDPGILVLFRTLAFFLQRRQSFNMCGTLLGWIINLRLLVPFFFVAVC